jgi:hypothetical protein
VSYSILLLLLLLQVKHFLFDFVLQTSYQLRNKGTYGHPGGILHSGLHVLGTALVLPVVMPAAGLWIGVLVGEFLVHYHIDWCKEQITRRWGKGNGPFFWWMLGLDQFFHQVTYLAIAAILAA